MKLLNPTIHGVLDYTLAIGFLILPGWQNYSPTAASLSYVIGAVYLGASLLTRYPAGVLGAFPFPAHGVLESIMAAFWVVMPWLFGFADDGAARNFFVSAGVALLLGVSLTRYRDREVDSVENRRRTFADRRRQSLPVTRNRRLAVTDRRVPV
jgi:hypothetical protein